MFMLPNNCTIHDPLAAASHNSLAIVSPQLGVILFSSILLGLNDTTTCVITESAICKYLVYSLKPN